MIDEETNTLIACGYLGGTIHGTREARAFSDWAISQLEQGRDTKNLRMVASMFNAKIYYDVEDHFRRSLDELGWEFPPKNECLERYSRLVASEIVEGKIDPVEASRQLYDLNCSLDYPPLLSNWGWIYWSDEDLSKDEHEELIKTEAAGLLAGETLDYKEFYRDIYAAREASRPKGFFESLWKGWFG